MAYVKVNGSFRASSLFYNFRKRIVLLPQSDALDLKSVHVRPGGLEPPTNGLKVRCSTIELWAVALIK